MKVKISDYPNEGGDRKVKVEISRFDVWSLDNTLAYVIHPALVKFKENLSGTARTDVEDAPQFPDDDDVGNEIAGYSRDRWNFILDEMIFAFENVNVHWEEQFYVNESVSWNECNQAGVKAFEERMRNGFRLFGKYYQALWI